MAERAERIVEDYDVDSETILELEDLVYVNAAMVDQADHWNRIGGVSLGISQSKLDIIRANYPEGDVGKCLIEMLAEWLKNSRGTPTWREVVKAICSTDPRAAEEVAKKLKDGPHSLITETIPGLSIEGVDNSVTELDDFADIIRALYDAKVTNKWLEIGLFLGISFGQLQTLKSKSDDDRVSEMVGFWTRWSYEFKQFGKPSWKNLVRAIGARAGGNARRAAKRIADKHKLGSADSHTYSTMTDGKDTQQYKTLFANQADLADKLGDLDGVALRLANKLFAMEVIGKFVRDAADIHGPHVTEFMRVNPIMKAMLGSIELNSDRYQQFRDALLAPAVGVHPDIVNRYVPAID